MDKKDLARVLREIGTAIELTEDNPFKARAYLSAARAIGESPYSLEELVTGGKAAEIKGLGSGLQERLREFHSSGQIAMHQELLAKVPVGLWEILGIPGLGTKRVKTLHELLGVGSLSELEYACHENRLLDLKGFGPKMQANVLKGLAEVKARRGQALYPEAMAYAREVTELLRAWPGVERVEITSCLRRACQVVDQVQLIVATQDVTALLGALQERLASAIESVGHDQLQGRLPNGLKLTVSFCQPEHLAYRLFQTTGSAEHLAQLAEGISGKEEELQGLASEEAIYAALGLPFIPPCLREGFDEIELARQGLLPALVELTDVEGVLHTHTTYSDGADSLVAMSQAAAELGWRYLGIADHSQAAFYAGGLKPEQVRQQWQEIDKLNSQNGQVKLLKGIEVDILADGSLDYDDELLAGFDYVIASVHSHLRQSQEQMMNRLLSALKNPHVTMLGHPTGRLLLGRGESAVDMPTLINVAAEYGKSIEVNANPYRLDLDWRWCRLAKAKGVKLAINPDAHRVSGLQDIHYGLAAARKAGLSKGDILHY